MLAWLARGAGRRPAIAGLRGRLPGCEPAPYIIRFTEDRPNPLYRRVCYTTAWGEVVAFAVLNIAGLAYAVVTGEWRLKQMYEAAYFPIAGTMWVLGALGLLPRVKRVDAGRRARAPLLLRLGVGGRDRAAGAVAAVEGAAAGTRRRRRASWSSSSASSRSSATWRAAACCRARVRSCRASGPCPTDALMIRSDDADIDALTSATLKHLRERWWDDEFTEFLAETLQPRAGNRILDVGCGEGLGEVSIGRLHISQMRLVGVDLVVAKVVAARQATAGAQPARRFAAGDACRLPFADGGVRLDLLRRGAAAHPRRRRGGRASSRA